MYSFRNDYSEGAYPGILEAVIQENLKQNRGYGCDIHGERARKKIKEKLGREDVDIHFLVGGTQTNLSIISAALRTHEAVIAADTGHVNVHETGAIESTGHKVIAMEAADGKLTAPLIQAALSLHTDEHMVKPAMVYISDSTEVGTLYTKRELEEISRICRRNGLYLFLDGARLGSALASAGNDLDFRDLAELTDIFYIGGTKNGALFGEAVVIVHEKLKTDFRYVMKQKGGLLAKGWLLGIQFEQLFTGNLYLELAAHANAMAGILKEGLASLGYKFMTDSFTNQIFPILKNETAVKLAEEYEFEIIKKTDGDHMAIRLVTSWATPEKECQSFLEAIKRTK